MRDLEPEKKLLENTKEENILQPKSIESLYNMLASKRVINVYRVLVRMGLKKQEDFNNESIDEALEEWDYIALCLERLPSPEDNLTFASALEKIREQYALFRKLSENATWNEVIVDAMSDFDNPIEVGIECGWSWDRVLQLYHDSDHIDNAIRCGADPDIGYDLLLEILIQEEWENAMSLVIAKRYLALKKVENIERIEKGASLLREAITMLKLPEDTTSDDLQKLFLARTRIRLSQLWNKPPDDITDEDIWDFLRTQD